jgi:hypothetical protein
LLKVLILFLPFGFFFQGLYLTNTIPQWFPGPSIKNRPQI